MDNRNTDTKNNSEGWPIEVNGHLVKRITPTQPILRWGEGLETDEATAFKCVRCGHEMNPPKGRVEDSRWVNNAFDCVDCDSETEN